MPGPTTFHLIRHATYGLIGHRLAGRTPGHALGEEGRAQAAALAASLDAHPLAAVIASPLERTRETAAAIAERRDLPVLIEPGLNEIDFGDWTGETFDVLHARPAWRAFNRFRSTAPIPGGETMLAAQARAVAAVLRLRAAYPQAGLALVSHADVIKAVLAHFLAAPLDLFGRIEIAPASRSVVVLYDETAAIAGINLPP